MVREKQKSLTEMELDIKQAMIRFEKECMGRGPFETRAYLIDDMVIVRLKGVLLPSEIALADTDDRGRARLLIKEVRQAILDRKRSLLESVVQDVVGVPVESIHTDISTKTGERVIIFTLKAKPLALRGERDKDSNGVCLASRQPPLSA